MQLSQTETKQIKKQRAELVTSCREDVEPMLQRADELEKQAAALRDEARKAMVLAKSGAGWRPRCTCDQQWTNPKCPAIKAGYACHTW